MQSFKRTSVTSEVVLVLPFCNTNGSLLFWLGDGSTVISGPLGTATFLPTTASSSGRTKECLLRGCLEAAAAAAGIVFLSSLLIIGYSGVLSNNLARLIFSRKDSTLIFSRRSRWSTWSNNSYCFLYGKINFNINARWRLKITEKVSFYKIAIETKATFTF